MDFGQILDKWERQQNGGSSSAPRLEKLIDHYPPAASDIESEEETEHVEQPTAPRDLPIESELDLHGFTVAEAERRVDAFLQESLTRGLKKVLIIHGKGNHSKEGGKLKVAVRRYLENHPLAGATGVPDRTVGGSGAVWVRVRQRSR